MKKQKIYFCEELDDEHGYTIDGIIELMKENGEEEVTIATPKRITDENFFFCKEFGEPGSKDDSGCGKECDSYIPRNGKSGCCKHRGYLYEPDKEFILKIDGTITPRALTTPTPHPADPGNE